MDAPGTIVCRLADVEQDYADRAWLWEPNNMFRCLDCGFVLDGAPTDSARFRAENHARDTGHCVGWFVDWPLTDEAYETVTA